MNRNRETQIAELVREIREKQVELEGLRRKLGRVVVEELAIERSPENGPSSAVR